MSGSDSNYGKQDYALFLIANLSLLIANLVGAWGCVRFKVSENELNSSKKILSEMRRHI